MILIEIAAQTSQFDGLIPVVGKQCTIYIAGAAPILPGLLVLCQRAGKEPNSPIPLQQIKTVEIGQRKQFTDIKVSIRSGLDPHQAGLFPVVQTEEFLNSQKFTGFPGNLHNAHSASGLLPYTKPFAQRLTVPGKASSAVFRRIKHVGLTLYLHYLNSIAVILFFQYSFCKMHSPAPPIREWNGTACWVPPQSSLQSLCRNDTGALEHLPGKHTCRQLPR